jgi:hypothetical protein
VGNFKGFSAGVEENPETRSISIFNCIKMEPHSKTSVDQFTLTAKLFAFENRKVLAHCTQARQIYAVFMADATINRDLAAIIRSRDPKKEVAGRPSGSRGWGAWDDVSRLAPGRRARRRVQRP